MTSVARIGLLLVLFACGGSTPLATNVPPQTERPFADARASKFRRRAIGNASVGAIEGHLRDRDANAPAVGATITVTLAGQRRVVVSQDDGAYVVNDLPPGRYFVAVHYNDLSEWHMIDVVAGFATLVDVDIVDPYGPARPVFP